MRRQPRQRSGSPIWAHVAARDGTATKETEATTVDEGKDAVNAKETPKPAAVTTLVNVPAEGGEAGCGRRRPTASGRRAPRGRRSRPRRRATPPKTT